MPTTGGDQRFLIGCVGAVVVGVALLGVGCWLMPLRALRHAWHGR